MIKKILNLVIIMICFCWCVTGCSKTQNSDLKSKILAYGDDFAEIELLNSEGETVNLLNDNKYRLVFVMNPLCGTCKKQLQTIQLYKDFYRQYMEVSILWEKEIVSNSVLEQYNIPKEMNYVLLVDEISISTPTVFIVGKDNKIIFVSTDMENIALKLNDLEGVSIERVQENVCSFLKSKNDTVKDILVYFSLKGCNDCKEADKEIDEEIENNFNIIKIYDESSYGEEKYVDINNIYRAIFNIDWYPSFLIVNYENQDYRFIGKTEVKDIKNQLMCR